VAIDFEGYGRHFSVQTQHIYIRRAGYARNPRKTIEMAVLVHFERTTSFTRAVIHRDKMIPANFIEEHSFVYVLISE